MPAASRLGRLCSSDWQLLCALSRLAAEHLSTGSSAPWSNLNPPWPGHYPSAPVHCIHLRMKCARSRRLSRRGRSRAAIQLSSDCGGQGGAGRLRSAAGGTAHRNKPVCDGTFLQLSQQPNIAFVHSMREGVYGQVPLACSRSCTAAAALPGPAARSSSDTTPIKKPK